MNILKFSTIVLLISFLSACDKDEKNNDDSSDRDDFIGFYNLTEDCGGNSYSYSITIGADPNSSNGVTVLNLGEEGEAVNATVSGNNISIPSQIVMDIGTSGQYIVQGNGTLNGNTLTLNYILDSNGCVATCVK